MYIRRAHQPHDASLVPALVRAHPLGAWVCLTQEGMVANHVPFIWQTARSSQGTLIGHVSRANPVWRLLGNGAPSVVMFQGPQAYISPAWYPGKASHGEVVPTWDYAVTHLHGVARAVHEPDALLAILGALTDQMESPQPRPWRVADAPAPYIERLLRGIVGIEITIERIEGKLKASQDEDLADRYGTVVGLQQGGDANSLAMAALVQEALAAERATP